MLIATTLALALLAGPDDHPWERARVMDALQHLIKTGEPRHIDHDEGQELWASLSLLLQAGADPELQVLAQRAACPVVVRVPRPIDALGNAELEVTTHCVLPLAPKVSYTAALEGNLDGAGWREILEVKPDSLYSVRVGTSLPREKLTGGFHRLDVRARITYEPPLSGVADREVRQLAPVAFGLRKQSTSAAMSLAAMAEYRARAAHVSSLDRTMPDQPLAAWLTQFASRVEWTTDWCDRHANGQSDHWTPMAVCEVAMFSAGGSTEGEVWIRIGELHVESDSIWSELAPSLEGAYLYRSADRTPVPLALVPMLVVADKQSWPLPRLAIVADDVTVPAAIRGGATVATVPVAIANQGQGDAFGITIDVSAGTGELPLVRRRFVRDIPAGGRVDIPIEVPLQLPYAWAVVIFIIGTHNGMLMPEEAFKPPFKVIFINRDATPPGFVTGVCQSAAGTPSC
jgi:hypothetical protein